MGGGRDHAQIKIESREDVVARSLARARAPLIFCIVNDTQSRVDRTRARSHAAREKVDAGDDGERARRVGRVDAHLRAERRGARTRVENL